MLRDHVGRYWNADRIVPVAECHAGNGDCSAAVAAMDREEWSNVTDSSDLATREFVTIDLPPLGDGAWGLVMATRQSLVPTFLLYELLASLGTTASDWLAELERADTDTRLQTYEMARALGGIELEVEQEDGTWHRRATVIETGPLASDVRVVTLPDPTPRSRVRLRFARGAWRIDYLAFARLAGRTLVTELWPDSVRTDGARNPAAHDQLLDSTLQLTTVAGEDHELFFTLPEDPATVELFLESQGYYLEWMREEWIADEDLAQAARFFRSPRRVLRDLAPEFKAIEATMEDLFWSSRYVKP